MKKVILILFIINLSLLNAMTKKVDKDAIDDWEYNSTQVMEDSRGLSMSMGRVATMAAPAPKSAMLPKKLGLAVGGAKDTNNFKANIDNGYLPKLDSITYEGQFYSHFFDTGLGGKECKALFCPSYSTAKRLNSFSKEEEYFLSVGLNSGIEEKAFKRKKLNLVVVLDISGSMGASFDSYYYDKSGNKVETKEKNSKKKMEIANESIVAMLSHLKNDDRAGVVLFDHNAYRAKPLRLVGETDRQAIKEHILGLTERGGTNWSAGYEEGLKLFDELKLSAEYENRIIFLTDAMPNRGELKKDKLFGMAKKASEKGIHTSFIGVGVDFNNDLVEYVSKTKGANYFSVHSSKMFKKLLDKEFDYMVTPLVYDLELKLNSKKYEIEAVYGSPEAKLATGEIMKVNTLFPSTSDGEATKGGVVLLKLKKVGSGADDIKLSVSYTDVNGKSFSNAGEAKFNTKKSFYYDNSGIHKAILVSDYVSVMKNWIIDARAGCNDRVKWIMEDYPTIMKRCMVFPPKRPIFPTVKTWERSSCKLKVSEGYKKLFHTLKNYYAGEMKLLDDDSLEQELAIINKLLEQKTEAFDKRPIDDWQFRD
ncbi:MAG: VWA domain-containing protein [Epsilonproteobacteria bacterium]|nr:VWA domain-containing protein [Campylobacterota bacterium]